MTEDPKLSRLMRLHWLARQWLLPESERYEKIRGIRLDMSVIIESELNDHGHWCASACCLIGTGCLDPVLNEGGRGLMPATTFPDGGPFSRHMIQLGGESMEFADEQVADWFGIGREDLEYIALPEAYLGHADSGTYLGHAASGDEIEPSAVLYHLEKVILDAHGAEVLQQARAA